MELKILHNNYLCNKGVSLNTKIHPIKKNTDYLYINKIKHVTRALLEKITLILEQKIYTRTKFNTKNSTIRLI